MGHRPLTTDSGKIVKLPADASLKGRGSSGEDAYEALYDALLNGQLKPGEQIREAEVARLLGMSRTPVREAMRRLETQGLLIHQPRKGMTIRQLDHQAITELYLVRVELEGMAAAEAARHASEAEIDALQEIVEGDSDSQIDPARSSRINKVFHQTIHRAAHNRFLLEILDSLQVTMSLLGKTTLSLPERVRTARQEHQAIVSAIAERKPEEAREAAAAHIRAAHRARLKMLFETAASE
ncbi:MAG TPA: GntR family transcriptional regulator [Kiloniellaceae bacterium]|nr:GntR family transcriptional regulator [Kiloniellaceae bacterium]